MENEKHASALKRAEVIEDILANNGSLAGQKTIVKIEITLTGRAKIIVYKSGETEQRIILGEDEKN